MYDLGRVKTSGELIDIEDVSDKLRRLSIDQLMDHLTLSTLSCFPAGTIFLTEEVSGEGEAIVDYQTVNNLDDTLIGQVRIPMRYKEKAIENTPGIMIYNGEVVDKDNRAYSDVEFLSFYEIEESLRMEGVLDVEECNDLGHSYYYSSKSTPIGVKNITWSSSTPLIDAT